MQNRFFSMSSYYCPAIACSSRTMCIWAGVDYLLHAVMAHTCLKLDEKMIILHLMIYSSPLSNSSHVSYSNFIDVFIVISLSLVTTLLSADCSCGRPSSASLVRAMDITLQCSSLSVAVCMDICLIMLFSISAD